MRAALLAAAIAARAAAQGPPFTLHLLENTDTTGAVCLDGSPGGFYLRPGSGDGLFGAGTWIIELEGGGWCVGADDCAGRAAGPIGSSRGWPQTGIPGMDGGANGMLSPDCAINPWCNATMVHVNYCDGGSFAGNVAQPVPYNASFSLHYRGAAIFDATVDALLALGMAAAKQIVLKGCSAGGLATYLHADYFAARMAAAAPAARVVAQPDAGFFRDHAAFAGPSVYTPQMQWVYNAMNVTQVDAGCAAAYNATERWRCFMAEYTLPFITTPLFATQDLVDSWQLAGILQLGCQPAVPGNCSAAQLEALVEYRASMLAALGPLLASPTNGLFGSACIQHCHTNINAIFTSESVNNVTLGEALLSWWTGAGSVPRFAVAGPWTPSNPACA